MGLLPVAHLAAINPAQAGAMLAFATRTASITCGRVNAEPPWLRELLGRPFLFAPGG